MIDGLERTAMTDTTFNHIEATVEGFCTRYLLFYFHLNYPDKPLCSVYMMKNTTNASSPEYRQIATSTPI